MSSPNFIDCIQLYVRGGSGGAGLVHFMRAKFIAKGGPDGGDGGRGGDIILRGNRQYTTLLHLTYQKHIIAPSGGPGGNNCKTGASGKDMLIDVPLGTVAKKIDRADNLVEVLDDKKKYILMQGGRGGWGNAHFKSPTRQAPRIAYPGKRGQEGWIVLELKLLADVGLIGLPNVGKSTLLSMVSAAKPRIDSYPFTTLTPNLGVVAYQANHSFVMADIPGLIKGAANGKGLGTRFLRHIERNSMLLFMVSAESDDLIGDYTMLLQELSIHNPLLLHKPKILAISKIDLLDKSGLARLLQRLPQDITCLPISAITGEGIANLKHQIWYSLHQIT